VIQLLLQNESKEKVLHDIIQSHRTRLANLFCKIHAPNEFEDVQLDSELRLLRRGNDLASGVAEISTGQRSALALSIFLTMYCSVSIRAPWLLFDDPVSYVDDLNILSFLDTLRDLVLLGNSQVFFATANTRIADLFFRKFDFLGPSKFKEIRLER
jgi:chromosome segregation protein